MDAERHSGEGEPTAARPGRVTARSVAPWWRALAREADAAVTTEGLGDLYDRALATVKEALGADSVAVLLANDSGDALVARASTGLGEEGVVGLEIPAGQGMAGRVLATRAPLIVDDLEQITLVSPTLRAQGLRSVVAVPIWWGDKVLGVLHAGSFRLASFSAEDAEMLEFLADRLGLALGRVRLLDEHRRLADIADFLARTARIMAEARDLDEALERLAAAALPALGDICLVDIAEDQSLRRVVARHRDPALQGLVDRLRTDFPPEPSGAHPAPRVMHSGQSAWASSMSDAFLRETTRDADHYALVKALGFRSYLAVPIASGDTVVGTLTTVSCGRPFRAEDVAFAECLAQQVGAVARNAQDRDLSEQTSRVLQASLLPRRLPPVPGMAVHWRYEAAAAGLDVGGDFYDLMVLPDGGVWFTIGDVEGHDRVAAAVMGQLRSAARVLTLQGRDPVDLVADLQAGWEAMGFDRIATALFGRIDPARRHVTVASAGHYPPVVAARGGARFAPVRPGPPLGAADTAVVPWTSPLAPGEVLVLYTDGALDDRDVGIEQSMAALARTVGDGPLDPEAVCDRVVAARARADDDVALLALVVVEGA